MIITSTRAMYPSRTDCNRADGPALRLVDHDGSLTISQCVCQRFGETAELWTLNAVSGVLTLGHA